MRNESQFYQDKENKQIAKFRELCRNLPKYASAYLQNRELVVKYSTLTAYAYDLQVFFQFFAEQNPVFKNSSIKEIPADFLAELTEEDIMDFQRYLREIFRILKPNGTIRLSVPDLELNIQQYLNAKKQDSTQRALASEYIRKLTQEYLHLSVWDYDRLAYTLEAVGFVDIQHSSFNNGRDTLLLFDAKERSFSSLYIEASKPL
ncbi:hypothetical protein [Helicobacter typhlonius]|uniref:hypothetical protein n=1 Tax=Helicobacter typhlonius TaxID=76936 RepID=UPI002FE1F8C7